MRRVSGRGRCLQAIAELERAGRCRAPQIDLLWRSLPASRSQLLLSPPNNHPLTNAHMHPHAPTPPHPALPRPAAAFDELFAALDRCEGILGRQRYIAGDALTEADIRLFMTLIRFDPVYVVR